MFPSHFSKGGGEDQFSPHTSGCFINQRHLTPLQRALGAARALEYWSEEAKKQRKEHGGTVPGKKKKTLVAPVPQVFDGGKAAVKALAYWTEEARERQKAGGGDRGNQYTGVKVAVQVPVPYPADVGQARDNAAKQFGVSGSTVDRVKYHGAWNGSGEEPIVPCPAKTVTILILGFWHNEDLSTGYLPMLPITGKTPV